MGFATLTLFFVLLLSSLSIQIMIADREYKTKVSHLGERDTTTFTYNKEQSHSSFRGAAYNQQWTKVDKELVTKVLLRTCAIIYIQSKRNGCPNPRNPANVWGFAGNINTTGSLLTAWTGTTVSTFSCANKEAYGRGLIQKAIPLTFIQNGNYRYDFLNMAGTERNEPCGYDEIIDIQ